MSVLQRKASLSNKIRAVLIGNTPDGSKQSTAKTTLSIKPEDGLYADFLVLSKLHTWKKSQDPPAFEALRARVSEKRPALATYTLADYQNLRAQVAKVSSEQELVQYVLPYFLEKDATDSSAFHYDTLFGNILKFNPKLSLAKPDLWWGTRRTIVRQLIWDALDKVVNPTNSKDAIVPNMLVEFKGPEGHELTGSNQACHYGAIGARAMHYLQNYGRDPSQYTFDSTVRTFTALFHGNTFILYGHYIAPPREGQTEPE